MFAANVGYYTGVVNTIYTEVTGPGSTGPYGFCQNGWDGEGGGGGGGRRGESTVEITWGMNVDANYAVGYRACVARAPY